LAGNPTRLTAVRECAGVEAESCTRPTEFSYSNEAGFAEAVEIELPEGAGNPVPFGVSLASGQGHDRLNVLSAGSLVKLDFAYNSTDIISLVPYGEYFAPVVRLLEGLFPEDPPDVFLRSLEVDFKQNTVTATTPCGANTVPFRHILRDSASGRDFVHDNCEIAHDERDLFDLTVGAPVSTHVYWRPREWFVDLDGDGVQDKLFCSPDEERLAYKFASAATTDHPAPPVDATFEERDGDIELPFPHMCRPVCDPQPLGLPPLGPLQQHECFAGPPASLVFDIDGDGTGNLTVHDGDGWIALAMGANGPFWENYGDEPAPRPGPFFQILPVDVNGDGLTDLLSLPYEDAPTSFRIYPYIGINTGNGFQQFLLSTEEESDGYAP
jgi:hypothetical protein